MHALISGGAPAQISAITALSSAIVIAKGKTDYWKRRIDFGKNKNNCNKSNHRASCY
jgi:hypothetical protein